MTAHQRGYRDARGSSIATLLTTMLVAAASVSASAWANSDQAVVRKRGADVLEVGQAFIVHGGGDCLALLPSHVVEEAGIASLRYVGTRQAVLGELGAVTELGEDLSMGRVSGALTRSCGHSIGSFSRAVDTQLAAGVQGTLRFVNGDGSLGYEPVSWLDDDRERYIRIQPTDPAHALRKGMSGSLLLSASGVPIGMLLSVSARSGVGTVLRMDQLLERAEAALGASAAQPSPVVGGGAADAPPEPAEGLELLAWSTDAQSDATRPSNLLARDETTGPWLSVATRKPVTLDFGLAPGTVLHAIVFDGAGVEPQRLPQSAEVFVAGDEGGESEPWRARSAWGGRLQFDADGRAEVRFAPSRARRVRLVLYPRGDSLSLRRIDTRKENPALR